MVEQGGYILVARKIDDSEVDRKPPHFRDIWMYLIRRAAWRDCTRQGVKLKRGQLLTSYEQIAEDRRWNVGARTMRYKRHEIQMALRFFTKTTMITTTKTTKGMKVTVLNYDRYQDPKQYETHHETHHETDTGGSLPYIEELISKKYRGLRLPKNFPTQKFAEYELARMNGKKDGRKRWDDDARKSAIKQFINLKEYIDEIRLDGFDGLNDVLQAAIDNKWRGFSYFKRSMKGIRERRKQAKERYDKKQTDNRPDIPTFDQLDQFKGKKT